MSATRIWSKFKELLDVSWGTVSDGYLLKRSGTNIIGVPASSVGQVWRGEYDPATTYQPNDAVSYTGSSYLCGATTTGVAPVPSTASYLIPPLATTGSMGSIAALPVGNQALYYARGDNTWSDLSAAVKPTIWSVRQRNFNALGNPNFEVDQRNAGVLVNPANGGFCVDRWNAQYNGTLRVSGQQIYSPTALPGTSFLMTSRILRLTLTTAQASLGAGDLLMVQQTVEGPVMRALFGDVHSVSLLVRSSVANLKFSVALRDGPGASTRSLVKLCSMGAANTWTMFTLPNLPVWSAGGTWSLVPGTMGYFLGITLASGTTYVAPAADVWQTGNYIAAPGMSNFASNATSSTFEMAFVQHEPGAECTTPIDISFADNQHECLRYYWSTFTYGVQVGVATTVGAIYCNALPSQPPFSNYPYKRKLARIPTAVSYYSANAGINNVRDLYTPTDRAVTSVGDHNDDNAGHPGLGTTNVASTLYQFHISADTGW